MKRCALTRKTPLRRKTRLRRTSPKYGRKLRVYSARRKIFLQLHPTCEIRPILFACGILTNCLRKSTQVHHTHGRGKYLNDESTWLASCSGECHGFVKNHQDIARRIGLLFDR